MFREREFGSQISWMAGTERYLQWSIDHGIGTASCPNMPMHRIDCNENESSSSNTLHSFTEGGYVGID